jgi:hypothetical protein
VKKDTFTCFPKGKPVPRTVTADPGGPEGGVTKTAVGERRSVSVWVVELTVEDPTDQQSDATMQLTDDKALDAPPTLWLGAVAHTLPSHRSTKVCAGLLTLDEDPTAQHEDDAVQATDERPLFWLDFESGVATTDQAVPSQCSAKFWVIGCFCLIDPL